MKKISILLTLVIGAVLMTGCNDADVASSNLSTDADNFKVQRINTVSDEVLYTVEGNMAIFADVVADNQVEITAKMGDDKF